MIVGAKARTSILNPYASCAVWTQELEDCHMESQSMTSDDDIMDIDERWEKGAANGTLINIVIILLGGSYHIDPYSTLV